MRRCVLAGEQEAFHVLVERYARPIQCMIRVKYLNWRSAEDVAQEVFMADVIGRVDCIYWPHWRRLEAEQP